MVYKYSREVGFWEDWQAVAGGDGNRGWEPGMDRRVPGAGRAKKSLRRNEGRLCKLEYGAKIREG
jgi:hypothetical protein